MNIICWWSAGVTSAVATKLALDKYGPENVTIYYFKIDSAHTDNERFMRECEAWYGAKIHTVQSERYRDQFDVIEKRRYVNGPSGALCTFELKKKLRQDIESAHDYDGQVFGFEYTRKEINRAIRFKEQYPDARPLFPLIEHKITKPEALYMLEDAGISRPVMYTLGYSNNNCIGCVKGGKGYWNKIRVDFPATFDRMSKAERDVGRSCIRDVFLDELMSSAGREAKPIMPDCGNFCDLEFADQEHPDLDVVYNDPQQLELFGKE